jgi:hypothetical protein
VARVFATFALVSILFLASCAGNGSDSKSDTTTGGGSAAGASGKAGGPTSPKHKRSTLEKTVLAPKPGTPALTGNRKAVYVKAKAACQSRGRRGIAREYRLRTRNATLVARLYAKKAFSAASQGAAFAGCVAGFR